MTLSAVLKLVGGVRAAVFLVLFLSASSLLGIQTARLNYAQKKATDIELQLTQEALAHKDAIIAIERAWTARQTELASQLVKENESAREDVEKLVSGLLAGTDRLHRRFQCPSAVPGASSGASGSDEGAQAGFSVEDAEVAFGIARDGDEAIRQLKACQELLK